MGTYSQKILHHLESQKIQTWFEIGYFLDRLKSAQPLRPIRVPSTEQAAREQAAQGIAFVTYAIGLDGVSIEMFKYATALRQVLGPKTPIHWIAGKIDTSMEYFAKRKDRTYEIPAFKGFELWGDPYQQLFHTKLKRGDGTYNDLPEKLWEDTKTACKDLLEYVEANGIECILTTNVASIPGNLPLALALVILSELYGVTVISSNHNFYWEFGPPKKAGGKPGPRDHFYRNADLEEVFSLLQVLYPWSSTRWIHANINPPQIKTLVGDLGLNPFQVMEQASSVDTKAFRPLNREEKEAAYAKLNRQFNLLGSTVNPEDKGYLGILDSQAPVIVTNSRHKLTFGPETVTLLQPTRITACKCIERDLVLIRKLFLETPLHKSGKSIVLLLPGPVSPGSEDYAKKLLANVHALFRRVKKYDHKIFVAFQFGTYSVPGGEHSMPDQLSMGELYGIASLAMFPSNRETRGLPILESAAACVPLVTAGFEPREAYRDVLGLDLEEGKRLKVLELPSRDGSGSFTQEAYRIISDQGARSALTQHNLNVVSWRYSSQRLRDNFDAILKKMWLIRRSRTPHARLAAAALAGARESAVHAQGELAYDKNRTYIPGLLKYRFLSQIKSIVDPSHFRIEEKQTLSSIFTYAASLVPGNADEERNELYFNAIEALFRIAKGRYSLELDTTYDYRYRDNTRYVWRELTEPQLFGVLNRLAGSVYGTPRQLPPYRLVNLASYISQDGFLGSLANAQIGNLLALDRDVAPLEALVNGHKLAEIKAYKEGLLLGLNEPLAVHDARLFASRIIERPQPLVILLGSKDTVIWELFALERLLTIWNAKREPYSLTFACRETPFNKDVTLTELGHIIEAGTFTAIKAAAERGAVRLVPVGSKASSIDLGDISPELKKELLLAKRGNGHVLAKGEQNYFSLDLLDLDSFRYGTVATPQAKAVFGVRDKAGFFQFVPAGFRTFFGFPLTVETPQQFSRTLNEIYTFQDPVSSRERLTGLKCYLDEHGTSLRSAIKAITQVPREGAPVVKRLAGKYADGYAWTGVAVMLKPNKKKHSYHILSSKKNKTLPQFVRGLAKRHHKKVVMGWNGGYILNNELVGKLKVSEHFIGTPLGFVVSNGRVMSLPLFYRPVFATKKNGSPFIARIKLDFPGKVYSGKKLLFEWKKKHINPKAPSKDEIAVYTPLSGLKRIPSANRILVIVGGRKIVRILYPEDRQTRHTNLFPAGVTFSLPASMRDRVASIKPNTEIRFDLSLPQPWSDAVEAMEAGPLLIEKGSYDLNLEGGGWLLDHSIKTQTGRRDRENNRWPLIGCGITKSGSIVGVVIESRIRESIGATNEELAQILIQQGAEVALGFDSGGSASLWADGGIVNIVPYASTNADNPFTGKSEPRPVANAVLIMDNPE